MSRKNQPYEDCDLESALNDAIYMHNEYGQSEHLHYFLDRLLNNGNYIIEEVGQTCRYEGRTKRVTEKEHMRISGKNNDNVFVIFKFDDNKLIYKVLGKDEYIANAFDSGIYN